MKKPCKQCPFIVGSRMAYDSDAMEALEDGNEPACHMQAGVNRIFAYVGMSPPKGKECAGYVAWSNEQDGYQKPVLKNINP